MISYIPSYALTRGMSSTQGALLLGLMALPQVFGQTSVGYSSDREVSINVLAGPSAVMASIAVHSFWGLADSFTTLVALSLILASSEMTTQR